MRFAASKHNNSKHTTDNLSQAMLRLLPSYTSLELVSVMQSRSKGKAPFSQYDSLQGAKIHWGSPSDSSAIPSGDFDVVYDNNGKDMEACKPLIDAFKVWHLAAQPSWMHASGDMKFSLPTWSNSHGLCFLRAAVMYVICYVTNYTSPMSLAILYSPGCVCCCVFAYANLCQGQASLA